MEASIRESDLPGIGRKFQIDTRAGDRLVIVVHDDGRRELYHFDSDDPEDYISTVTLDDTEARQVAAIIGGMIYKPQALASVEVALDDLIIEWLKVEPGSACIGKSIGDQKIRHRTGATIIAVVEKDHSKRINPGPEQIINEDAVLVITGERQQIQAVKKLLTRGGE